MKLLTKAIEKRLRANHFKVRNGANPRILKPALKVFNPMGAATWLFTELDEDNRLFGLCDLGMGSPELGYASLDELQTVRVRFGLGLERDLYFTADKTIEEYTSDAKKEGRISA